MKITWPKPGKYIVAVSGGADSVALLDVMAGAATERNYELVVAHFNHGWPGDDRYEQSVRESMKAYKLPLEVGHGATKRAEADARAARYAFLRKIKAKHHVDAIMTAHHQDDLEETVILNVTRGTGRRGLTPFANVQDVVRPLVGVRKKALIDYATERQLIWCHDTYNDDLKFARNRVRHELLPAMRNLKSWPHEGMTELLEESAVLNQRVDSEIAAFLQQYGSLSGHEYELPLAAFRTMPPAVSQEILMSAVLVLRPGSELDRRSIEALAIDLKTGRFSRPRHLTKQLSAVPGRDTFKIVFIA